MSIHDGVHHLWRYAPMHAWVSWEIRQKVPFKDRTNFPIVSHWCRFDSGQQSTFSAKNYKSLKYYLRRFSIVILGAESDSEVKLHLDWVPVGQKWVFQFILIFRYFGFGWHFRVVFPILFWLLHKYFGEDFQLTQLLNDHGCERVLSTISYNSYVVYLSYDGSCCKIDGSKDMNSALLD